MSNHRAARDIINGLIACDDQPNDACLGELRKTLEHKVINMKQNGEMMKYVVATGLAIMALGAALLLVAYDFFQDSVLLSRIGNIVLVAGVAVLIIGALGRARFQGLDYIWARDDLHDSLLMDLSLQVRQLTERMDALDKNRSVSP